MFVVITSSDLAYRLTGGPSNSNRALSIGGQISSVTLAQPDNTLFDEVNETQSNAGYTDYRCFAVRNNHATLTYRNANVYVKTDTTSTTTNVEIALDPAGVVNATGATATLAASKTTAPTGVTFGAHSTISAALSIGNIGPGQVAFIWVKYVINAGTNAIDADQFELEFRGGSSQ